MLAKLIIIQSALNGMSSHTMRLALVASSSLVLLILQAIKHRTHA